MDDVYEILWNICQKLFLVYCTIISFLTDLQKGAEDEVKEQKVLRWDYVIFFATFSGDNELTRFIVATISSDTGLVFRD